MSSEILYIDSPLDSSRLTGILQPLCIGLYGRLIMKQRTIWRLLRSHLGGIVKDLTSSVRPPVSHVPV